MSKTIEEAAKDYAYDIGDSDWERMRLQDAFIDGINHIMQLPLCDRLTAKEKERVRKMYKEELEFAQFCQRKANSCCNQQCRTDYEASRDIAKSRANMLESIFGAEMFDEKVK